MATIPVSMYAMTPDPKTAPKIVPTPPHVGVPPTKTLAKASSRYPKPYVGHHVKFTNVENIPAKAAPIPQNM